MPCYVMLCHVISKVEFTRAQENGCTAIIVSLLCPEPFLYLETQNKNTHANSEIYLKDHCENRLIAATLFSAWKHVVFAGLLLLRYELGDISHVRIFRQ